VNYFERARTSVLALFFLMFLPVPGSAQSITVTCSGSLHFNLIPGNSAVHLASCYAAGNPGTIISSSMTVYLAALPQAGSNTLPAGNIAVSPNNASFTAFAGVGSGNSVTVWSGGAPPRSSSPQAVYVQVSAPSNQPSGQYSGNLTVEVDVNYTP
jgi:hypothetical protein